MRCDNCEAEIVVSMDYELDPPVLCRPCFDRAEAEAGPTLHGGNSE